MIYEIKKGSYAEKLDQPQFLRIDEVSEDGFTAWVVFSNDYINWRPHSINRGAAWIDENYNRYVMRPVHAVNRLSTIE